jgi:hypothetical protein
MYSKKTNYQSGRPDLNGRPLDPQSHSGHRWASPSRAHWALEQVKRWPDVAECGLKKPVRRYDTKLWMRDLMEGAAYLPK